MADNKALGAAKEAKQDEFYTSYEDIQKEMNAYIEYNPDAFTRIYKQNEMDADHVTAWSNGGATNISNCTMLCKTHNRAKGNK